MDSPSVGPAEVSVIGRRRTSSAQSTSFEYPTNCRVEEDILSRIRALVLSRNTSRPPRTPHPSDERNPPRHENRAFGSLDDYISPQKPTRGAHSDSGYLGVEPHACNFRGSDGSMDIDVPPLQRSRQNSNPSVSPKRTARLRGSSSANDLRIDGGVTDIDPSTDSKLLKSTSTPKKKYFTLPRLVVRDIKEPDYPSGTKIAVGSCMPPLKNIYQKVPSEDTSDQDANSTCPHCEQPTDADCPELAVVDAKLSRFSTLPQSPPEEVKGQPEIVCSPTCPPNCQEHYIYHPLPNIMPPADQLKIDIRLAGDETTNLDFALNDIKAHEALGESLGYKPKSRESRVQDNMKSESSFRTATITNPRDTEGSPPPTRGSSVSSVDTFPHVLTSEMAVDELVSRPLSSAVVTNFSLPGPKAKATISVSKDETRQAVPPKLGRSPSVGSIRAIPKTPSLLSGASRTSVRHSLLKTSLATGTPVDTGLPVSPVLTPVTLASNSATEKVTSPQQIATPSLGTKIPLEPILADLAAAASLSSINRTNEKDGLENPSEMSSHDKFVIEEMSPSCIKLGYIDKSSPSVPLLTAVVTVPKKPESTEILRDTSSNKPSIPERNEARKKVLTDQKSVEEIQRRDASEAFPSIDPLNASYWGFVPAVRDAVQNAVKVAVRNAIQDIVVPPGIEKAEASDAYRMLVADSLAAAAKTADEYLRRDSLWTQAPESALDSAPESYFDDKSAQISRIDFSPTKEDVPKSQGLTANAGEMEEIPLGSTSGNRRHESSKATTTIYNAIPPRDSSKNRAQASKNGTANVSPTSSQKDASRRRESKGALMSVADSTNTTSDDRTMNSKNTVHWLKELLSSNDAYAPRLTALPPRSRRAEALSGSSGRQRSFTAPTEPVEELFLGATASPLETKPKITFADPKDKGAAVAATFTRTINDLEKLLNEALSIAKQAAERNDDNSVPNILNNAAAILKGGRQFMDSGKTSVPQKVRRKPRAEVMSSVESLPSAHESARSYSGTSTEGNTDDDEFTDDEIIDQAPTTDTIIEAPAERQEYLKIIDPSLDTPEQDFRRRERSATWDSSRALQALDIPVDAKKQRILTQRHSIPRQSTAGVSPSSESNRVNSNPVNGNLEKPSRTTTSGGFGWQDISERPTIYQSPSILRSQSGEEVRPGKQLYEEDTTTLAKLPVTTLRGKSSVSNSLDGSHPSETVDFQTGFHHEYIMQHVEGRGGLARSQPRSRLRSRAQTQYRQVAQGGEGGDAGAGAGGEEDRDKVVELRDQRPAMNRDGSNRSANINMNMSHHFFNLQGKRHVSLKEHKGFSLARTHKRRPIARDWSPSRKRFTAVITCLSTFLIGLVIGIYAGEVPSIQYSIVDLHHFTVLGNVFFFIGLAIPTTFFWPLPLLHGRKPYILGSMSLAMPLLFPQALAVGATRNPKLAGWRIGLLLSRSFMGFALGFANMNFLSTLMDLFGASLQSANPHQEYVDEGDVRRHGGGMGLWLGIWTWCYVGSIGVGFLLGAVIINFLTPAWGFYISIAILALVLVLNVVAPEVRRSAFRRSVAEVRKDDQVSRRLAKGEVKMHRVHTGPKWWGEEFHHGVLLTKSMMRQPGFLVLAFYQAWIYGQIILIMILLGSLTSKYYKFKSPYVGASVASIPLGALLSVPFQKAGVFSRERKEGMESDDDTLKKKKISLSSHFVRPYTLSSTGPPVPFILPIIWAAAIGFLSNLAVAECNGIIMETFDTSDLQPGMTGRPRSGSKSGKVTNYSCFPRVCAAFGITQGMGFCIAAMASGIGGVAQRHLGQQAATGVMCGVLLILSILLICVLARFQDVQIIPESKTGEMERYQAMKREQYIQGNTGNGADEEWRPIIIGNPTHIMRRMSVLEMGSMTRWTEIRNKNRLVDEKSLEARHANLNTLVQVEKKLKEKRKHVVETVRRSLSGSRDGGDDVREYSYEEKVTTRNLVPVGGAGGYGDERMDFRDDRMGKVMGNSGRESRGGDVRERVVQEKEVTTKQRSKLIPQGELSGLTEIDLGVPEAGNAEVEEQGERNGGARSRGRRSRGETRDSARDGDIDRDREGYDPRLRRGTVVGSRGISLGS
ncbi:putative polyamine transport protein [Botrytis fragariae]|uniref:Putative polyamine transport protein n=1 Tax=Botrytis fragariae TaxID=1964551 RepID=A0A8H6AWV0_9HELO|nr:putative polyamine transport protein [Botrytis fragariae]KAF5874954.1 putative polyamine transport protein [Botrytis fragariae]